MTMSPLFNVGQFEINRLFNLSRLEEILAFDNPLLYDFQVWVARFSDQEGSVSDLFCHFLIRKIGILQMNNDEGYSLAG